MASWTPSDLLPGAYVALLALALAGTLRRWYDPVPWRALGLFAVLLLVLFGPCLFLGKILLPLNNLTYFTPFEEIARSPEPGNYLQADLLHQMAPYGAEVRRCFGRGEWPLGTPRLGAGMPLLADPQAQHFQPLTLLALPLALASAVGVVAALRVLVGLVFSYLFLRRQGAGELPALGGSLAYGLGGFFLLWLGWPHGNALALLPFLLYALVRAVEEAGRRDLALLTVATAAVLLAGHPELIFWDLVVAGTFAVVRVLARPAGKRLRSLGAVGAAIVLGCGLAAPALLPALDYLPQSLRFRHGTAFSPPEEPLAGWWEASGRAERLAALSRRFLPVAAPNAYGNNQHGPFWGELNVNESGASSFPGTVPLFAALAAVLTRRRRLPQERLFLGLALAAVLILAQAPAQLPWMTQIPLLGSYLYQSRRIFIVLFFSLTYLAACTFDRWQRQEVPRLRLAALAAGLALLLTWGYLAHPHPDPALTNHSLQVRSLAIQLAALAGAGAALFWWGRGRTAGLSRWCLVALVAAELIVLHRPINAAMPGRLYYPTTPPIRFLQENLGPARMVGVGNALPANFALIYDLADVRVYNPLTPHVYGEITRPLWRRGESEPAYMGRPEHPIYDLLGVRYVLAKRRVSLPPPLRCVLRDPAGWVWERPRPLPRLFLPASAAVGRPGIYPPQWVARNPDFAARVLVEPTPGHREAWSAAVPGSSELAVLGFEPTRIRALAELTEERLLASSVHQDGGWRLLVDRQPRPTCLTNGAFVSAWLGPGAPEIDLIYRPRGLLAGALLAAVALAAAACWWLPPPRRSAGEKAKDFGAGEGLSLKGDSP